MTLQNRSGTGRIDEAGAFLAQHGTGDAAEERPILGKVPIWAQRLMIAVGVLLSPVFVLFSAWFIGWPRVGRLWQRREVGCGAVRRAEALRSSHR